MNLALRAEVYGRSIDIHISHLPVVLEYGNACVDRELADQVANEAALARVCNTLEFPPWSGGCLEFDIGTRIFHDGCV